MTFDLARTILGKDFITPEEVTKARPSYDYTDGQIMALSESLPSEEILKWCKDNGYAVMPVNPMGRWRFVVREIQSAHDDEMSSIWLAIKKTPVANSTSKTWDEQNKLLSKFETVPEAGDMSWFVMTYFEVRGVRLFEGIYVRTSSLNWEGNCIIVGCFRSDWVNVSHCYGGYCVQNVGLSAARKL